MKNQLIFFFTFFLTGLIWLILVPIWHFPDEQSHFGQVAFIAEKGRNPKGNELDLTEEIYASEKFLGTARDNLGNNRFTFHPEYRIEYTDTLVGKYEASVAALSKTEAKNTFVHQEAARYPELYYIPASIIYKLFYTQDLFTRVSAVRFWSLFLFLINVFITYRIGILLNPKDPLFAQVLTTLVGFQPMMVFSNVGVNSDALGNMLFTLFIFLCLRLIKSGISRRDLFWVLLTCISAIYAKPQFIIVIPILALVLLFIILQDTEKKKKLRYLAVLGFALAGVLMTLYYFRIGGVVLIDWFIAKFNFASFIKFTLEYTLPHTFSEVFPWYWGIYDWLGVTYPRIVHKIINRIVVLATVGFAYWLYKNIREKRWKQYNLQGVIFLIIVNILYFGAISYYDWLSWYTNHFPLGVQGRYFFPLISSQMVILLLGWQALFPNKWNLKLWGKKILGFLMVILNFYALYTIAKTYYDISSFQNFLQQASQYKPFFLKGINIIILAIIYLMTITIFLIKYIQYSHDNKKQKG